jgi:dTDP-4-dehydrorhamnose reductase
MKRLLITGGSGLLGGELVRRSKERWDVLYTWLTHPVTITGAKGTMLDVLDNEQVSRVFQDFRPDVVIHTAYSQESLSVITCGTENITRAVTKAGARLIYLSTDAVFDGWRGWYREDDIPSPVHGYGKAKLEAERIIVKAGIPSYTIIRTSLLVNLNPLDTRTLYLKNCLEAKKNTVYFTDDFRCPVLVTELAAATLEIAELDFNGIIHVTGPERLSRYMLARKLAGCLGLDTANIIPGLSSKSGLIRPLDCSMDTSLSRRLLRTKISSPSEFLSRAGTRIIQ